MFLAIQAGLFSSIICSINIILSAQSYLLLYMQVQHRQAPPLGKVQSIAEALFFDWHDPSKNNLNPPSQKHSSLKGVRTDQPPIRLDLIADLFQANQRTSQIEFTKRFIFGHKMSLFHHKKPRDVVVYLDQHFPALLWITMKNKSFLIDLTYSKMTISDLEFQLLSKREHYLIVRYFQEEFVFLFQIQSQKRQYYQLFNNYHNYHQLRQHYPPYFSKLIKHYMGEQMSSSPQKNREVKEVLKTVQKIAGEVSDLNMDAMQQILNVREKKYKGKKIQDAVLTVGEVIDFMKIASCNQNLKAIFQNYAGVSMKNRLDYTVPLLEVSRFQDFLREEQHQREDIIQGWKQELRGPLSFYSFCTHLISKKWNYLALIPEANRDHPLTDYYIYSSHNTYLSGNQLTSNSKVERYMEDLKGGVKCMEIDVHDENGEPIVTQSIKGFFLNRAVTFQNVIKQIGHFCERNEGFDPIILSIQNHTTGESKKKAVQILSRYLEKYLFTIDSQKQLKSINLGQLQGKVIVKSAADIETVTKPREKKEDAQKKMKEENSRSDTSNGNIHQQKRHLTVQKNSASKNQTSSASKNEVSSKTTSIDDMAQVTGMFKSTSGITIRQSTSYECTSVDSEALLKISQSTCQAYCRRSFLRVYPVASSIGSGNYDPVPALSRGAQIIALNAQTKDEYSWMMMSFFTAGSESRQTRMGYIEKPIWLRTEEERDNRLRKIQLAILSKKFDVKIKFMGSEEDRRRNQESHYCFTVRDFCEGFLMFEIGSLKDCIPTRFMRQGYRVVTGRNSNYCDCGVRVLMKVKITVIPYY